MGLLLLSRRNRPTLDMSFLGSMPSTVAFARASAGWCYNAGGTLTSAPSGTPRFDYNPATLTLNGLLLEEQRQNIQLQSQFNGTGWSTSGGGYSANSVVAPDGTTTAARLTEDTSTGGHFITPSASVSITSGATYAVSAYIKAGTRQYVALNFSKSTNNYATVVFDVVNGLVGESAVGSGSGTVYSKSIQNVGNGWFRCSMVCSVVEPAIYGAIVGATILTGNAYTSGGQPSYTGTSATFYVWGYQIELGACVTSYIPTTSSAVTRSADTAAISNVSWFNAVNGSFMVDAIPEGLNTAHAAYLASFSNGTTSNYIASGLTTASKPEGFITVGGSAYASAGNLSAAVAGAEFKTGQVYKSAANAFGVGGIADGAGTFGGAGIPSGVNTLRLGDRSDGTLTFNGWLRRFSYWNYPLTAAQLTTVTK